MIIVNTDFVQGKKIVKTLGVVKGNTIRAKHVGKDIVANLRQLVGGELKEYTEMLTEARKEAMYRMVEEAKALEADGIINVRFTTSQIMASAAEIMVYGTAVKLE
jgi:uncharacterized protein YbjQ (UPF0145 family)